ncbi:glycosyl hydrolase family 28-related protein, partial [Rhodospirillum rubrum]
MRLGRRALLVAGLAGWLGACAGRPAAGAIVTPRDFGARGDGQEDDAAAFQAAIDSEAPILHVPPGRYRIGRPLVPRSNQHWRGDGAQVSVLAQPADDVPPPFNLIERHDRLENVSFSGLGFLGNAARQTTAAADGQHGFALSLRGAIRALALTDCHISGFGDGANGGGGVVIGPAPDSPLQALEDITLRGCRFEANGNVPGVYLSGGDKIGARRGAIRVIDNHFTGIANSGRAQNCVYILGGGPQTRIEGVIIEGNSFALATPVDACIELNWAEAFTITANTIVFDDALDGSSAILLRDGCKTGSVSANTLSDRTPGREVGGILLLNFADPGTVEDIVLAANSLSGFSWRAVAIDRGSRGIVVTGNRISGGGRTTKEAIRVAGARTVLIEGNVISGARFPVLLAGQGSAAVGDISILGNFLADCGGEPGLIDASAAPDLRGLVIGDTTITAPRPGTRAL